jgi:cysteine desulfurase family protein (TIGR01976 family)
LGRKIGGLSAVFLDGPAGSQVPESVISAVSGYLRETNANHDGVFPTSRESDALIRQAHQTVAAFMGDDDPDSIVFGANMTSLTFSFSRALARTWRPGDEILVTRLDHDANVTPWTLAARDAGVSVRHVDIHPEDCSLDLNSLTRALSSRTRLVAVTCASNAVGTRTPVCRLVNLAHEAGAQVYLDAVHYVPHGRCQVKHWGADFVVASAYKFFGPHVGILWGRRSLLESLPAYKVRPAPDRGAGRWMTGTQNHEGIMGVVAATDYLAAVGRHHDPQAVGREAEWTAAYQAIHHYENGLLRALLAGLAELPEVKVFGVTDPSRFADRVPTVGFTHARLDALGVAQRLAERGLFVWHGNFYALPLTEALKLEPEGMVRVGLLHYNTREEVDRLLSAIKNL